MYEATALSPLPPLHVFVVIWDQINLFTQKDNRKSLGSHTDESLNKQHRGWNAKKKKKLLLITFILYSQAFCERLQSPLRPHSFWHILTDHFGHLNNHQCFWPVVETVTSCCWPARFLPHLCFMSFWTKGLTSLEQNVIFLHISWHIYRKRLSLLQTHLLFYYANCQDVILPFYACLFVRRGKHRFLLRIFKNADCGD